MKTKTKSILSVAAALVIGYCLGVILGFPDTSGSGQGNVSKVSKFHSISVSPAMSAFQEKLQNDSTELAKAAMSITVLSSRMNEFSELVNIAVDVADNNVALAKEVETLKTIQRIADNAVNAGKVAASSFSDMASGARNNSASEFEQASQNLTVAYLMVDRQVQVGKQFVVAVDNFLKGKDINQYGDLALARDLWASYCEGNAVLNGDDDELVYWQKLDNTLTTEQFSSKLDSINNPKLISSIGIDALLGLVETGKAELILGHNFYPEILEDKDKYMQDKDKYMQDKDKYMQDKDKYMQDKDKYIQDKDKYIQDKDKYVQDKDKYVMDKDKYMQDKDKYVMDKENFIQNNKGYAVDVLRHYGKALNFSLEVLQNAEHLFEGNFVNDIPVLSNTDELLKSGVNLAPEM